VTRAAKIDARQQMTWLLVGDLERAPDPWGRPVRIADARQIAVAFDPDALGALAVWHRPDLPVGRGQYVIIDGQHRWAALRLMGYEDQRVPCLVYCDLTNEAAAELSLALQERRNLHTLDKYRAELAAHDRRAIDIDKITTLLDITLVYTSRATDLRRVNAVSTLGRVWDLLGAEGLERVLRICDGAWEGTASGFGSRVLLLTMTLCAAHPDLDDDRLAKTLGRRSPAQWTASSQPQTRPMALIAIDVITAYNNGARSRRVAEKTPTEYTTATKRSMRPTVRGPLVDVPATAGTGTSSNRRRRSSRR
jgi:hypothetical protein